MDWIALALTLLGLWLVGSKKPTGFLVGGAGNMIWILWGMIDSGSLPIILTNVAILFLNMRAWIRWRSTS